MQPIPTAYSSRRGSALIIATILVMVVLGMTAVFLVQVKIDATATNTLDAEGPDRDGFRSP